MRPNDVAVVMFTIQAATVNRMNGMGVMLDHTRRILEVLRAEGVSSSDN